jgi:hypothetical protein
VLLSALLLFAERDARPSRAVRRAGPAVTNRGSCEQTLGRTYAELGFAATILCTSGAKDLR